jgi:hypothetical protein
MFDLDQSIAAWRQQMRSGGLHTDALLDELESHLREETARRMHSGMAAPEAFAFAVRQIGSADVLQAEFAKVSGLTSARLRAGCALGFSLELAIYTALQVRQLWKAGPSHQDLTLGIMGLATTLGAAYAIWRLAPIVMRRLASGKAQTWMIFSGCVSALVWMVVFAWFILPGLVLTPGQFAVVFLWAMLPMVVAPILATGAIPYEGEPGR